MGLRVKIAQNAWNSLQSSNLGDRNIKPLLASLDAAVASFDRGNLTSGVNQVAAFQKKVQVQIAPGLPGLANDLIAAAQVIIDAVTAPPPPAMAAAPPANIHAPPPADHQTRPPVGPAAHPVNQP